MATPTFTIPQRSLTWLITGSSSGFGLSLARAAQAGGHTVIATSRNPSRTPDLVREVESKGGKWLKLDVDDLQSGKLVEQLESSGTAIDVLVNNAGYSIYTAVESFTEEEVRQQMESMYFGPLRLIRAILPYMRKRKFGVLVNMSSGAALEGRDSMGAYAGTKAAIDGMSKVLFKEVAPFNIRTLVVSLGTFNTNMGNATIIGENPLPDDYKGSVTEQMLQIMGGGKFQPDGDKDKAMKAVYEVVTGTGVGSGLASERFLPLGRDLTPRLKLMQDQCAHTLEVFGDVANNVYRDDKK